MLLADVQPPAAADLAQLEPAARAAREAVVVLDEPSIACRTAGTGAPTAVGEADEALGLLDDQQDRLQPPGDIASVPGAAPVEASVPEIVAPSTGSGTASGLSTGHRS